MKIPVFVSCPTALNPQQKESRRIIIDELEELRLEPRALGRSDYPTDLPLREVYVIAKHCSGGIILGFEQFFTQAGTWKRGTDSERCSEKSVSFPTPWNHLEAGVLFGLQLPLLIFKENGIEGGVFDEGVTDVFIHKMPAPDVSDLQSAAIREVFLKWESKVRGHYYAF